MVEEYELMLYSELNEQELARLCCGRDRMAVDELYKRYATRVYALCRRYIRDDEEAKDLMQDSLVQAVGSIMAFRFTGDGSLYNWLARIAINRSIDHIRGKRKWPMVPWSFQTHDDVPAPDADEVDALTEQELLELIDSLPDVRRSVFYLYCMDGYSHKEIADLLGITASCSSSILAKARKQLKKAIKEYLER